MKQYLSLKWIWNIIIIKTICASHFWDTYRLAHIVALKIIYHLLRLKNDLNIFSLNDKGIWYWTIVLCDDGKRWHAMMVYGLNCGAKSSPCVQYNTVV